MNTPGTSLIMQAFKMYLKGMFWDEEEGRERPLSRCTRF